MILAFKSALLTSESLQIVAMLLLIGFHRYFLFISFTKVIVIKIIVATLCITILLPLVSFVVYKNLSFHSLRIIGLVCKLISMMLAL